MALRGPYGRAGRGPGRHYTITDDDNWTFAVCGRVLPGYEPDQDEGDEGDEGDDLGPEGKKPPRGPSSPTPPGSPPGPTGPDKNPPVPPNPPPGASLRPPKGDRPPTA